MAEPMRALRRISRAVWLVAGLVVVLVSGFSFAGYLAAKWLGAAKGLLAIARRVHAAAAALAEGLKRLGLDVGKDPFFDTLRVRMTPAEGALVVRRARDRRINLRAYADGSVGVALDETVTAAEVDSLIEVFAGKAVSLRADDLAQGAALDLAAPHARKSDFLTHPVFSAHHSETEMMRYIRSLERRERHHEVADSGPRRDKNDLGSVRGKTRLKVVIARGDETVGVGVLRVRLISRSALHCFGERRSLLILRCNLQDAVG